MLSEVAQLTFFMFVPFHDANYEVDQSVKAICMTLFVKLWGTRIQTSEIIEPNCAHANRFTLPYN